MKLQTTERIQRSYNSLEISNNTEFTKKENNTQINKTARVISALIFHQIYLTG